MGLSKELGNIVMTTLTENYGPTADWSDTIGKTIDHDGRKFEIVPDALSVLGVKHRSTCDRCAFWELPLTQCIELMSIIKPTNHCFLNKNRLIVVEVFDDQT